MASLRWAAWALLWVSSVLAVSVLNPNNNFTCQPTQINSNPIVLLHGLGATYYEDLNELESWLKGQGFCTFSLTYGSYLGFPWVGGLMAIEDSAPEIATLIRQVSESATGAGKKVTLIGHSEGAFMALYVPKFNQVANLIGTIISIAPPTHGTSFFQLFTVADLLNSTSRAIVQTVVNLVGCSACNDLGVNGPAVLKLDNGPIVQPGNKVTVIASKDDTFVTPADNPFVEETGVTNLWVQSLCPNDPVGHIGEAYDQTVWNMVYNALNGNAGAQVQCSQGIPT
jgi:triacylglycerol esterase/lipase EstA (alpha/beta hydrolase family)